MLIRIRDFIASDLVAIHAINEASGPGVHTSSVAELTEIAGMSSVALVAEVDGELSAFCLVLPPKAPYPSMNYAWFSEHYEDFIYLDRVAVAPVHRGRGLGSRLYAEVERRTAAPWFTLEVNLRPRNDGSLRFHARHGFVEVGQQETDYGSLVSLMAKRLG